MFSSASDAKLFAQFNLFAFPCLLSGDQGITPLHDACSSGCTEMIQFLMEAGASVIAKDNEVGRTQP